jgi:hypothetical protein
MQLPATYLNEMQTIRQWWIDLASPNIEHQHYLQGSLTQSPYEGKE